MDPLASQDVRPIGRPTTLSLVPDGAALRSAVAALRDVADLAKPGISTFVVFSAAMGVWLAPAHLPLARAVVFLAATALLVGSANTLNCWLERDTDARMRRTRNRPLPAGRLDPWAALSLGVCGATFALPALALTANRLTAALGLVALLAYVGVYTPLKRLTPRALEVGGIPGAIPPLMGWAAATGNVDAGGWALFAILYFWQLPHFVAIALWVKEDYARGGIRVLPVASGDRVARGYLVGCTAAVVLASLAPAVLGLAGAVYVGCALVLGGVFLALSLQAWRAATVGSARRVFVYSLIYLAALLTVLVTAAAGRGGP